MRKRTLSRVDVLENEERSRNLDEQSSAATIFFCFRRIVFAYYVGGLKPNDEDPGEAHARALNHESMNDYLEALLKGKNKKSIDNLRMLLAAFCKRRPQLRAQPADCFDRCVCSADQPAPTAMAEAATV
jgi:hypothetical protein